MPRFSKRGTKGVTTLRDSKAWDQLTKGKRLENLEEQEELLGWVESIKSGLSKWELGFLKSVRRQFMRSKVLGFGLTQPQVDILVRICGEKGE